MKYPSEIYQTSDRFYKGIEPIFYPFHDKTIQVTQCGRLCEKNLKVNLIRAFAGQEVGIKEVEDGIWIVSFLDYDLGYFDQVAKRVEPVDDPFKIRFSPVRSGMLSVNQQIKRIQSSLTFLKILVTKLSIKKGSPDGSSMGIYVQNDSFARAETFGPVAAK